MINGIKPLPSVSDFDGALDRLLDNIHKDYEGWSGRIEYSSGAERVNTTNNRGRFSGRTQNNPKGNPKK